MCMSSVHILVILTFLHSEIIVLSIEMLNWHTSLLASSCNHADVDKATVARLLVLGPEPAPCGAFSECCCSSTCNHVWLHQVQHIHKKQQASNKSDKQWNHKSTCIFCQDSLRFICTEIHCMTSYMLNADKKQWLWAEIGRKIDMRTVMEGNLLVRMSGIWRLSLRRTHDP